jgi:maltose/moltooligosaccharide transporter
MPAESEVYRVGTFWIFALRRLGCKQTHAHCLLCGALGLMSVAVILLLTRLGAGIAWASTLSKPYAVLAGSLPPARTGVYMGIFNSFILMPEILASLFFGWIMIHLLHNNQSTRSKRVAHS